MPPLVIVDEYGNPLMWNKPKPPTVEVLEEPLHVKAARQHAKDSTSKKDEQ